MSSRKNGLDGGDKRLDPPPPLCNSTPVRTKGEIKQGVLPAKHNWTGLAYLRRCTSVTSLTSPPRLLLRINRASPFTRFHFSFSCFCFFFLVWLPVLVFGWIHNPFHLPSPEPTPPVKSFFGLILPPPLP